MKRLVLFIPLIIVLFVGLFFYSTMERISEGEFDPQAMPSALLNKPLPAFELPDLLQDEAVIGDKDLLGEIALINVWATWCPSCHIEHPYLNYLSERLGVKLIGINYKDDAKLAKRWLKNKGNPYALSIFDQDGKLGLDLGVTGAPETYVIDHRGFVRYRYQGPMSGTVWREKFLPVIEALQLEQQTQGG